VAQVHYRQFARLLVERLGGQRLPGRRRDFEAGTFERMHVELSSVAPNHFPTEAVGVLSHGIAAGVIV
jgi:hypothetical protein